MQSTRYSCPILMKLEFSQQILEKIINTKFHKHPSSGSRNVPYGRTDGRTDMTNLTVAFRSFAIAPESVHIYANQAHDPSVLAAQVTTARQWSLGLCFQFISPACRAAKLSHELYSISVKGKVVALSSTARCYCDLQHHSEFIAALQTVFHRILYLSFIRTSVNTKLQKPVIS